MPGGPCDGASSRISAQPPVTMAGDPFVPPGAPPTARVPGECPMERPGGKENGPRRGRSGFKKSGGEGQN